MTDQTLLGSLREENGLGVVHVEDVYATDIDDLWAAITQPDRLKRWIGDVAGNLTVGGEFTAAFTSHWTGSGVVEVCEAPHLLRVRTWQPGDEPTTIEARLTAEDGGTRLVIEDRGLPLAEYPDHGAGWQAHIEDLRAHLEDREPMDWATRWRQLISAYVALAGR